MELATAAVGKAHSLLVGSGGMDDACSYRLAVQSITLRLLYTLAEPELTSDTGLQDNFMT